MSKLTPPAVRFIRAFDVIQSQMVNVWFRLETQEQIDDNPMAFEIVITAKNLPEAIKEMRKHLFYLSPEELQRIEDSANDLKPIKETVYRCERA